MPMEMPSTSASGMNVVIGLQISTLVDVAPADHACMHVHLRLIQATSLLTPACSQLSNMYPESCGTVQQHLTGLRDVHEMAATMVK